MNAAPEIKALHRSTARAFAFMVKHPDRWVSVADLVEVTGAGRATIYRRFANLTSAKVLQMCRLDDQRHFKLHPQWSDSTLAVRLLALAGTSG